MTTIEVLEKYKNAVMSNERYSQILVYAYYKGWCNEQEITLDLKISLAEVVKAVKSLFLDGFLQKHNDQIKVTLKTIRVLEELNFGTYTSDLLVQKEVTSKIDNAFFQAYFYSNINQNTNSPITVNLRNLKKAIALSGEKLNLEKKKEMYWTVIIGNDEFLRNTNYKLFVSKIIDFHSEKNTEIWKKNKDVLLGNKDYYELQCITSKSKYFTNNEIIADRDKRADDDFNILYLTRLFNCLEDQVIDSDLKHIWKIDYDTIKESLLKIKETKILRQKFINYCLLLDQQTKTQLAIKFSQDAKSRVPRTKKNIVLTDWVEMLANLINNIMSKI